MRTLTIPGNKVSIIFFGLTILWILLRLPTPIQALAYTDGGHQLTGALQILHGEHPFVDYEATYGPFTFYASALAQLIFDNRLLGEYLLLMLGYAIAYAVLTRMIYRLTGNLWLTLLFGIFSLAAIPPLYKYYIVLGPALTLLTIWKYLEQPNQKNMVGLALAITVTGLFRADFGVYCTIAGILGVLLLIPHNWERFKQVCILLGEILLFALPWLLFLTWQGGLVNYFRDMTLSGLNLAMNLSLPLPVFHPELSILDSTNLFFCVVVFFSVIPFIIFGWLFFKWDSIDCVQKRILLIAAVLNLLSLIQAYYRISYLHLVQAIPMGFLLSAWMAKTLGHNLWTAFRANQKAWIKYGVSLVLLYGFLSMSVLLYDHSYWPKIDLAGLYPKLVQFSLPKEQLLNNLNMTSDSRSFYVQFTLYIRRCTTSEQKLMALPALTTIPYFTDRSFGGGQIGVLMGYFVTDKDQIRVIQKMATQDIPLIVYAPNLYNDGIPERKMAVVAPKVATFIQENYIQIKKIGPALLLMQKDLKIDKNANLLADMSCPHP